LTEKLSALRSGLYSFVLYTRKKISAQSPIFAFGVVDPGGLSRIPDPDFYPSGIPDLRSRIPDPKTAKKREF
jgi:hypothetical protein